MRKRWRRVQHIANDFWTRWRKEYLTNLQQRQKWNRPKRNLMVGDIILLKDDHCLRNSWPMAKVIATETDNTGLVRSVTIRTANTTLRRPIHKTVLLLAADESHT